MKLHNFWDTTSCWSVPWVRQAAASQQPLLQPHASYYQHPSSQPAFVGSNEPTAYHQPSRTFTYDDYHAYGDHRFPISEQQPPDPPPQYVLPSWYSSVWWYFLDENQQPIGPYPFATLQKLHSRGYLTNNSLVWAAGYSDWQSLTSVLGFSPGFVPVRADNDTAFQQWQSEVRRAAVEWDHPPHYGSGSFVATSEVGGDEGFASDAGGSILATAGKGVNGAVYAESRVVVVDGETAPAVDESLEHAADAALAAGAAMQLAVAIVPTVDAKWETNVTASERGASGITDLSEEVEVTEILVGDDFIYVNDSFATGTLRFLGLLGDGGIHSQTAPYKRGAQKLPVHILPEDAHKVFEEMSDRDLTSWYTGISSVVTDSEYECGGVADAANLFRRMLVREGFSWTEVVHTYIGFGLVTSTLDGFRRMLGETSIADNSLFVGFCTNGVGLKALQLICNLVEGRRNLLSRLTSLSRQPVELHTHLSNLALSLAHKMIFEKKYFDEQGEDESMKKHGVTAKRSCLELLPIMMTQMRKKRNLLDDGVFFAELNEVLTHVLAEDTYSSVAVRDMPMRTEIVIRATRMPDVLGEKGWRIMKLTLVLQRSFKFPENDVELSAGTVNDWGLCAIVQAESLRYKLLGGLAVQRVCYGALKFVMEHGAKGFVVNVSSILHAQCAKSMNFKDGVVSIPDQGHGDVATSEGLSKMEIDPICLVTAPNGARNKITAIGLATKFTLITYHVPRVGAHGSFIFLISLRTRRIFMGGGVDTSISS